MSVLAGSRNKSEVYSGFKSELGEIKEIVEEVGEAGLSEDDHSDEKLQRQFCESLHYETDEEEKYDATKVGEDFLLGPLLPRKEQLGPLLPLKEQLEKDKEDESLRRWKEQLLGSLDIDSIGERLEPDVKILNLSILSPGRADLILPIPFAAKSKVSSFTLKEGSRYSLKFCFSVLDNIVSGLTYINTVWKSGVRVDNTRVMLGTFSPQQEPCTYVTKEETTPSGILARGYYTARTKFVDDDDRCYLEMNYSFEIRKNW